MRKYNLDILGYGQFVVKVPIADIQYYQAWLKDAKANLDKIRAITKEQERIEEDMFLQAATECEKDFYYLEDNIEIEREDNGEEVREYLCLPVNYPDGWIDHCGW